MGSGPKEKMAPLKKARLCLLAPLFFTGLLLIFTFLLLFAGSSPGLLPSAHVFTLQSHRIYLMTTCPDNTPDDTLLKCEYNPALNPIKWAALWYWAASVALATALPFQSYLIYRPDPKWAKWALLALLPATCMLAMGFAIAMFIGNAAKANPITFIGQSPLSAGEPNPTFTGLTMVMAIITFFDCLAMWYLKKRFGKKPVTAGGPPYPPGGISFELPKSTRHTQDTNADKRESGARHSGTDPDSRAVVAQAMQGFSYAQEPPSYGERRGSPTIPPMLPQTHSRVPPGQPRGGSYPSNGYGGHRGRGRS